MNPNEDERLSICKNAYLKRDETILNNLFPKTARAENLLEKEKRTLIRRFNEASGPEKAAIALQYMQKFLGGAETVGDFVIDNVKNIKERPIGEYREWQRQQAAYEKLNRDLVRLLTTPRSMMPKAA